MVKTFFSSFPFLSSQLSVVVRRSPIDSHRIDALTAGNPSSLLFPRLGQVYIHSVVPGFSFEDLLLVFLLFFLSSAVLFISEARFVSASPSREEKERKKKESNFLQESKSIHSFLRFSPSRHLPPHPSSLFLCFVTSLSSNSFFFLSLLLSFPFLPHPSFFFCFFFLSLSSCHHPFFFPFLSFFKMPPKSKKDSKGGGGQGEAVDESRLRIAIVNADRCKPKKCRQECKRNCPVVRTGKLCIEVDPTSKIAFISEPLCIGCGICVKKCPFEAIAIINLPKDLGKDVTHRFGANSFKLHRLPVPRPGQVVYLSLFFSLFLFSSVDLLLLSLSSLYPVCSLSWIDLSLLSSLSLAFCLLGNNRRGK